MAKVNDFKPGDKVVWFRIAHDTGNRNPVIAWICDEVFYPSTFGHIVRLTRHPKDAKEGKGIEENIRNVFHWVHDLWTACDRWYERLAEIESELSQLRKGKIPKEYRDK